MSAPENNNTTSTTTKQSMQQRSSTVAVEASPRFDSSNDVVNYLDDGIYTYQTHNQDILYFGEHLPPHHLDPLSYQTSVSNKDLESVQSSDADIDLESIQSSDADKEPLMKRKRRASDLISLTQSVHQLPTSSQEDKVLHPLKPSIDGRGAHESSSGLRSYHASSDGSHAIPEAATLTVNWRSDSHRVAKSLSIATQAFDSDQIANKTDVVPSSHNVPASLPAPRSNNRKRKSRTDSQYSTGGESKVQSKSKRKRSWRPDAIYWAHWNQDGKPCPTRITNHDCIIRHMEEDCPLRSQHYNGKTMAEHIEARSTFLKKPRENIEACETFSASLFARMFPNRQLDYLRYRLDYNGNLLPLSLPHNLMVLVPVSSTKAVANPVVELRISEVLSCFESSTNDLRTKRDRYEREANDALWEVDMSNPHDTDDSSRKMRRDKIEAKKERRMMSLRTEEENRKLKATQAILDVFYERSGPPMASNDQRVLQSAGSNNVPAVAPSDILRDTSHVESRSPSTLGDNAFTSPLATVDEYDFTSLTVGKTDFSTSSSEDL